jgi:hypothetical protein
METASPRNNGLCSGQTTTAQPRGMAELLVSGCTLQAASWELQAAR